MAMTPDLNRVPPSMVPCQVSVKFSFKRKEEMQGHVNTHVITGMGTDVLWKLEFLDNPSLASKSCGCSFISSQICYLTYIHSAFSLCIHEGGLEQELQNQMGSGASHASETPIRNPKRGDFPKGTQVQIK